MAGDAPRIKRTRYRFSRIDGGEAFEELKRLSPIPSHKQLTLRSIYDALEEEVNQVKNDINGVYQAVRNDINLENEQMETVEHQLKKSVRKVNHIYDKVLANRTENDDTSRGKMIERLLGDVDKIDGSFKEVDNTVDSILSMFSQIDAKIPQQNRLLNGQVFNEQHYPLLFGLIRQKFGDQFLIHEEEACFESPETFEGPEHVQVPESDVGQSQSRSTSSMISDSQVEPTEEVSNLITRYRISQAAKATPPKANDTFLPPSLRKASVPSTKTTFETITAEQLRNADISP